MGQDEGGGSGRESELLGRKASLAKGMFVRYLVPSILSLLANSINLLIDTAIVGNFVPHVGLAAMSVVAPVTLIYYTVGSTICVGSSVCFSAAVGAEKFDDARAYLGFAMCAVGAAGVLFTAVFLPFTTQVAAFLGASGELVQPVRDYLFFYFLGGSFTMFLYLPLNFAKALGKPNIPLVLLLISSILNVTLAWVLVAVMGMGVGGAALATVISLVVATSVGCVVVFRHLGRFKPTFSREGVRRTRAVVRAGSASGLNNFARFCTVYGMNLVITLVATSGLLATYAIARTTQDTLQCVVLGISQAVMPLAAMFAGERDNFAVRTIVRSALRYGLVIMGSCSLATIIFQAPIVRLFGAEPSVANAVAITCVAVAMLPSLVNNVLSSHYSSTGKYWLSLITLVARVACTVGTAPLAGMLLGGNLIWLGFPVGECLTLGITNLVVRRYASRQDEYAGTLLLPTKNENIENLRSFSIEATELEATTASERVVDFLSEKGMSAGTAMRTGISLEEIIVSLVHGSELTETDQVDVRVFYDEDGTVLRFRYGGKQYDPFLVPEDVSLEDDAYGMELTKLVAKDTDYRWLFGMNNLVVIV